MRDSRLWRLRVSLVVRDGVHATQADTLHRRWADLDAARPATLTGPATELLRETIASLQASTPSLTPSSTSLTESGSSSLPTPPPLLGSRESAQHIWRSLRRQRVAWQEVLALLPWQLLALTPAQRQFLSSHVSRAPWRVVSLALAAWDMHEDAELVRQYRSLKSSSYMVEYARLVSAALRERPSLPNGLLPVPYGVMQHGYALGRRSPQDAKIALALSKHMTLLGREALTREAEERLVLSHAALEGLTGRWQTALGIVRHSRAVRLSAREGAERYVQSLLTQHVRPASTTATPLSQSRCSSASKHGDAPLGTCDERGAPVGFAAKGELHREGASPDWVSALHAFITKEPQTQTYPDARRLLGSLPPEVKKDRVHLLLASAALSCCARRMFAGTLTRRVTSCVNHAEWAMALALTCAAQYYDVAAPLIPFATMACTDGAASVLDIPPELHVYMTTVNRLKREELKAASAPLSSPLSVTAAAALTYPEALAHALAATSPTTWRTLLLFCPHTGPPTRLRYFLLAACNASGCATVPERTSENPSPGGRIECCTFQSQAVSRLVCAAADLRDQQYFFRVISASARAHHFECSPLTNTPMRASQREAEAAAVSEDAAVLSSSAAQVVRKWAAETPAESTLDAGSMRLASLRLQAWRHRTATTPEECAQLLADVSLYFVATHAVEGVVARANQKPRLKEVLFLKSIAALAASGVVQLPPTERFHWPLAVLKAARLLRVTVDASLVALTARTLPSVFVDRARLVLPSILGAHTLLGDWKAGLQLCMRLLRKEQNGELELNADGPCAGKPDTQRFTAPPPTLLEAMAQVGYACPTAVAVRHWKTLGASSAPTPVSVHSERGCPLPLLLLELQQFRDERQLCEEVRDADEGLRRGSAKQKLQCLSRRRLLLGAAFSLLESEAALRRVLRAVRKEKVHAADVDAHGLQRVLSVLPSKEAAQVLAAEAREGRCAQEHWLCEEMSRTDLATDVVDGLARLRPSSTTLSAILFFKKAAAAHDAVGCLKGLVRLTERANECPYPDVLLLSLLRLLRFFLSHDELISASLAAPELAGGGSPATLPHPVALALAYKLFNRMQEIQRLSLPLKSARRVVRRASDANLADAHTVRDTGDVSVRMRLAAPCAVLAVLGVLHSTASSVLQVPVPATFTSHLLSRVVETSGAADWTTALLFFKNLRHPTMWERALLVRALRHCGGAATPIILSHRRFLRDCPDQIVIWADEASGPSKWLQSMALLERAQKWERRPTASVAGVEEGRSDPNEPARALGWPLSPTVSTIIHGWSAGERRRCGELLRRHGFITLGPTASGQSLDDARVTEMTNARVQRQTEAILQLLKEKSPIAVSLTNGPPPLPAADVPDVMAELHSRQ
ncbi:hypothetical protein LSCM4_01096 [Leishmania orientalis]|uniref:Uncharacterized protein n=1 Tax=Leishmania orientalis TaxID=2249476 RepID=A0A836G9J9_9TRYP|nr:hypothetical protein LSCM4_01096 [Leishmania orientalis]